jgi:acetylornithine deacetylase
MLRRRVPEEGTVSELEILDRLVAFDTVSRNSNLELVGYVREYLAGHGVEATILPSADGRKANVLATIGPSDRPGLLLSGHTDVVPVDGQAWTTPPFRLTRENGRVQGRGTCDMKGFVACCLALVPALVARDLVLPVHLALSYDEEIGCFGAHGLARHLRETGLRPLAAFVGEPTRMAVVNGHKGSCGVLTEVQGLTCHSSRPDQGVNAVYHALDLIGFLRAKADALAAAPDPGSRFEPPYTTIGVGTIEGGTARNAVPGDCRFQWDIRATRPGMIEAICGELEAFGEREVLPRMRERCPEAAITTALAYDVPPLVAEPGGAAEALAARFAGTDASETMAYGSDAGIFQDAGISTVVCGPGDIAQAHVADEWIEVAQLEACSRFLERLADHATNPD